MSAMEKQKWADVGAWAGNVSTSVLIVFVNKLLMQVGKGYGFRYGT